MTKTRLSRRNFLKLSAVGAGSLAAASVLGQSQQAQAHAATEKPNIQSTLRQAQGKLYQPSFAPMPSQLEFGQPADISVGWDGTLWAIDGNGTPYKYDPVQQVWDIFGSGVKAACWLGEPPLVSERVAFFRNDEYYFSQGPNPGPHPISELSPKLPTSFQLGVNGAGAFAANFYLFKGGQYADYTWSSVKPVTDIGSWPKNDPNWKDGVIDLAASFADFRYTMLFRMASQEVLIVDLSEVKVSQGPAAINTVFSPAIQALLAQGRVNAMLFSGDVSTYQSNPVTVFAGAQVLTFNTPLDASPANIQYLRDAYPDWPSTWNPKLAEAPSGYADNLWAITTDGVPINSDGENFTLYPLPNGATAVSISVSVDQYVLAATADAALYQWSGGAWIEATILSVPFAISQVVLSDAEHVWLRDDQGNVLCVNSCDGSSGVLAANAPMSDLSAGSDGTLWFCKPGDPSVYRYLRAGTQPPEVLSVDAGVSSVGKVAATGFGQAWFVANGNDNGATTPQFFAYDSPYVFKTSSGYSVPQWTTMAQGAGKLFFVHEASSDSSTQVIALDVQTGAQLGNWMPPDDAAVCTSPVYEPALGLIYVGTASTDPYLPGNDFLYALDADTLAVKWTFSTWGMDAPPALTSSQLIFGDRVGKLTSINTSAALAQAATGQPVTAQWQIQAIPVGPLVRMQTPVASAYQRQVYVPVWVSGSGSTTLSLLQCNLSDGSALTTLVTIDRPALQSWSVGQFVPIAPVLGGMASTNPLIIVHGYDGLWVVSLASNGFSQISVPSGSGYFSSGLTYNDDSQLLYLGDSSGNLYIYDFSTVTYSSVQPQPGSPIIGKPLLGFDTQGQVSSVFFGTAAGSLWDYSPATQSTLQIAMPQAALTALSTSISDGVIYAAGSQTNGLGQVFALRVDESVQTDRGFVIESQLMQDYDDAPVGTAPPTNARYQTHVTVVDGNKVGRPFQSLKIWADETTTLAIDGQLFTGVGPTSPASVQTTADGSITIVSGCFTPDPNNVGQFSDQSDIFATSLRIWAPFMDATERIVIYPDREFHIRLSQTIADSTNDDPDTLNLATAQTYSQANGGSSATLLSSSQASELAKAVNSTYGSIQMPQPMAGKYLAYDDLPGAFFFPNDTSATVPVEVTVPVAYMFDETSTYSSLAVADATSAIDGLTGTDYSTVFLQGRTAVAATQAGRPPKRPSAAASIWDWFKDIWNWIKQGLAKLLNFIISIGKEIYIGLQFIYNGVTYVVRSVVNALEVVAAAIGSFFLQLGKVIEDVVEALSILFNFGEILKTHNILKGQVYQAIDAMVPALVTNTYPFTGQWSDYNNLSAQGIVDKFFNRVESEICSVFCNLKNSIDSGSCDPSTCSSSASSHSQSGQRHTERARATSATPISNLQGAGTTARSAFTTPANGSKPATSHAPQCTWLMQKLKQNHQQATTSASLSAIGSDPISDFFTSFADSLRNNTTLSNAIDQTGQNFADTFKVKSASQFFQMALVDLIDVIEDLVIASLAVSDALFDGLFGLVQPLHDGLFGADGRTGGLFNSTLNIPVIAPLYKLIVGDDLTFLDLILLIAAIPVTILYRAIEGKYPSQEVQADVGALSLSLLGESVPARVSGLLEGILYFALGILAPISDAAGGFSGTEEIPVLSKINTTISVIIAGTDLITINTNHSPTDLVAFSVNLLGAVLPNYFNDFWQPIITTTVGVLEASIYGFQKYDDGSSEDDTTFSVNLLSAVPSMGQFLKSQAILSATEDASLLLLLILDLAGNWGAAGAILYDTVANWDNPGLATPLQAPKSRRLYLPWISALQLRAESTIIALA